MVKSGPHLSRSQSSAPEHDEDQPLRCRIENARKRVKASPAALQRQDTITKQLQPAETRVDAKRRRFLEGMHKANHEAHSLTIASPTTHLERDKMLYYKAIQEASQTPMDFVATLRTTRPMPDGFREEELRKWRRQFSASVSAEQRLADTSHRAASLKWQAFCGAACDPGNPRSRRSQLVAGEDAPHTARAPATPDTDETTQERQAAGISRPKHRPGVVEQPPRLPQAASASSAATAAAAAPAEPQRGDCESAAESASPWRRPDRAAAAGQDRGTVRRGEGSCSRRSPGRAEPHTLAAAAGKAGKHALATPYPIGTAAARMSQHSRGSAPRSAATGGDHEQAALRSERYRLMPGLPLVPNVAVRPDHGAPWDIREGTQNAAITDAAVPPQELQRMLEAGALDRQVRGRGGGAGTGGGGAARAPEGRQGRFLQEMKRKMVERVARAARGDEEPPEGPPVAFEDLDGTRGCGPAVLKELPEKWPFLDWIRKCRAADERKQSGAARVLDRGLQTAAMRRRNAFLLSVLDDGTGQLDAQHGGGSSGAFNKGHVAAVHYAHERPQQIQWEIPAQFASRMVQGGVNDAIQQAKLLQRLDAAILPRASKARARAMKMGAE
eukprot:jgi/Ulvmu1/8802/UM048_0057.1